MTLRKRIEDALAEKLRPLEQDGPVAAIEFWQGRREPDLDDDDLIRVVKGRTPALLITTGDAIPEGSMTGRRSREILELFVIVVSGIQREHAAGARGNRQSSDPGAYALLERTRAQLDGRGLEVPETGTLRFVGERFLDSESGLHAWQLAYELRITRTIEDTAPAITAIALRTNDAVGSGDANPVLTAEVTRR